jgi:hypothetical protein
MIRSGCGMITPYPDLPNWEFGSGSVAYRVDHGVPESSKASLPLLLHEGDDQIAMGNDTGNSGSGSP